LLPSVYNLFHGIRATLGIRPQQPILHSSEMATTSSADTTTIAIPVAAIPTAIPSLPSPNLTFHEKLEGPNYLSWLTQFLLILHSTDSLGIIDGSNPCPLKFLPAVDDTHVLNPEFTIWQRKDRTILSWINITLSKKVLSTIYGLDTSRQVWTALANQFANQSKSWIANLKKQLQSLHQGSKTCSDYVQTAKEFSDQLAVPGKPVPDEDLITYLTNGLNPSFNNFITSFSIMTRDKTLSLEDFQDELINHETLLNHQQSKLVDTSTYALLHHKPNSQCFSPKTRGSSFSKFSSINFGSRFEGVAQAPTQRYNAIPPPSRYSAPSRFSTLPRFPAPRIHFASKNKFPTPQGPRTPCQICGKMSHNDLDCYHRMDHAFQGRHPPSQLHAMAAHTTNAYEDQEWYADSAANAHITHDLNNLHVQQPFHNFEAIAVSNGSTLAIANTVLPPSPLHNLISFLKMSCTALRQLPFLCPFKDSALTITTISF
jgi:hypothetical protein